MAARVPGGETPAPDRRHLEPFEEGGDEPGVADQNLERRRAGRRRGVEGSGQNFDVRGFAVLAAEALQPRLKKLAVAGRAMFRRAKDRAAISICRRIARPSGGEIIEADRNRIFRPQAKFRA